MFRIRFLPAGYGDCVRIAYGDPAAPRVILIDGGTGGTRKAIQADLNAMPGHRIELIVVTHIDRDHIEGILSLLERTEPGPRPFADEIWFNGWPQLPNDHHEVMGAKQGERLAAQIVRHNLPWNAAFHGGAVLRGAVKVLPGGMRLRVLHPTRLELAALKDVWQEELETAGLIPGVPPPAKAPQGVEAFGALPLPDIEALAATEYDEDTSVANLSSIALVLEYGKLRVLLPGDVPATPLLAGLGSGRHVMDLVKLSHHGSARTTSTPLIESLACGTYVVSTSGALYGHPDGEALARVIKAADRGVLLGFNFDTAQTRVWDSIALRERYGYRTKYPDAAGIEFDLSE